MNWDEPESELFDTLEDTEEFDTYFKDKCTTGNCTVKGSHYSSECITSEDTSRYEQIIELKLGCVTA